MKRKRGNQNKGSCKGGPGPKTPGLPGPGKLPNVQSGMITQCIASCDRDREWTGPWSCGLSSKVQHWLAHGRRLTGSGGRLAAPCTAGSPPVTVGTFRGTGEHNAVQAVQLGDDLHSPSQPQLLRVVSPDDAVVRPKERNRAREGQRAPNHVRSLVPMDEEVQRRPWPHLILPAHPGCSVVSLAGGERKQHICHVRAGLVPVPELEARGEVKMLGNSWDAHPRFLEHSPSRPLLGCLLQRLLGSFGDEFCILGVLVAVQWLGCEGESHDSTRGRGQCIASSGQAATQL